MAALRHGTPDLARSNVRRFGNAARFDLNLMVGERDVPRAASAGT
jgi:hypothetical protein